MTIRIFYEGIGVNRKRADFGLNGPCAGAIFGRTGAADEPTPTFPKSSTFQLAVPTVNRRNPKFQNLAPEQ
jgi:hypothetical protein